MYKWDAGEALQLIERERPKQWTGVPTMVQDLMEHPGEFKCIFKFEKSIIHCVTILSL